MHVLTLTAAHLSPLSAALQDALHLLAQRIPGLLETSAHRPERHDALRAMDALREGVRTACRAGLVQRLRLSLRV